MRGIRTPLHRQVVGALSLAAAAGVVLGASVIVGRAGAAAPSSSAASGPTASATPSPNLAGSPLPSPVASPSPSGGPVAKPSPSPSGGHPAPAVPLPAATGDPDAGPGPSDQDDGGVGSLQTQLCAPLPPTNINIPAGGVNLVARQNRCVGNAQGNGTFRARFIFQADGNLVLYDEGGRARFASNTAAPAGSTAHAGWELAFQTDGNLVIYDGSNHSPSHARWASNTAGRGRTLTIQTDGNVVIYDGSRPPRAVWATNTARGGPTCEPLASSNINIPAGGVNLVARQNRCVGNAQGNGTYRARFIFQADGNLVLYDENGKARFASNTAAPAGSTAHAGWELAFQTDGNLVIYDGSNHSPSHARWASNTAGRGRTLTIQTDGNVVIYDGSRPPRAVWATNTNHG